MAFAEDEPMYRIDNIEAAKMSVYEDSRRHLSVTLRKHQINMTITDKPQRPIMLPITESKKETKFKRPLSLRNSIKVKVLKG